MAFQKPRLSHFSAVAGIALFMGVLAAARAVGGEPAANVDAPGSYAYLSVEYSNTLEGTQALYAVRDCVCEDQPASHIDTSSPGQHPVVIRETLTGTNDDLVTNSVTRAPGQGSDVFIAQVRQKGVLDHFGDFCERAATLRAAGSGASPAQWAAV